MWCKNTCNYSGVSLMLYIYLLGIPIYAGFIFDGRHPNKRIEVLQCLITGIFWPALLLMGIGVGMSILLGGKK